MTHHAIRSVRRGRLKNDTVVARFQAGDLDCE